MMSASSSAEMGSSRTSDGGTGGVRTWCISICRELSASNTR